MSKNLKRFSPLREIIGNIANQNKVIEQGWQMARLQKDWAQIIGGELAQQCLPEKIAQKTLWLSTSSPAWGQQLHFYQTQLLEKVNVYLKRRVVERIYLVSGERTKDKAEEAAERLPLSDVEIVQKRAELGELKDEGLRESLARLWAKAVRFFKQRPQGLVCKKCGQAYRGTHPKLCQTCEEDVRQAKKRKVAGLLSETPWATFSSLKTELKSIGEDSFLEIKDELRRRKHDTVLRGIFNYLDRPEPRNKSRLQQQILEYVELRSGLTPDKINDKIIQETLGSRKVRLLKLKGVKI